MKKRVFSGIRPSGGLQIGNYLGAIKQWLKLQDDFEVVFGIMDEHAITTPFEPEKLGAHTLETAMLYIAAGLDPQKTTLMVQSWVPAHTELAWILGTMTPLGELERMTQFKEKAGIVPTLLAGEEDPTEKELAEKRAKADALRHSRRQAIYAGLLNYPVLMAADILLYHTEVVPVGEDQVQHIELTRSIAKRFNSRYGDTFTIPEVMLRKEAARIMSLTNPLKKMSKSDTDENGYILLTDSPDTIRKKLKAAVTDSGKEIVYDPEQKPAIANLLIIFSEFSGEPIAALEKRYAAKGYADFKADVAEAVVAGLAPLQQRFTELKKDESAVTALLREGSRKAAEIADKTLARVKERIGFAL